MYIYMCVCVCVCVRVRMLLLFFETARISGFGLEENVLFNDTVHTFYLCLYGAGHMVKDYSDSERGNRKPAATIFYWQRGMFYMHQITDRIVYTTAFVTPVVEHCLQ